MMSLQIDSSQVRSKSSPEAARPRRMKRLAKTLALTALGLAGIASFSVAAYSMLGTLAGPQVPRVTISQRAADWPDLKDGVPALAPRAETMPAVKMSPAAPAQPIANSVASAAPARANILPIEVAAVVEPVRQAALIGDVKTAALLPPRANETVRARAIDATLAALPPEAAAKPARKPVAAARAKPAAAAELAVVADAAPAESDETEVFGVKVPSLASSGRKLVEGVQSLGDAVAKQF
jgi:hypothetical protein